MKISVKQGIYNLRKAGQNNRFREPTQESHLKMEVSLEKMDCGGDNMAERLTPKHLKSLLGKELCVSDWLTITQDRINAFARCTEDRQWIHVDVERAREGPLGSTVAHGFLILSLLPYFHQQNPLFNLKFRMAVNYGLNRVRFVHSVKPGDRIRNRTVLKEFTRKGFFRMLLTIENTIEIDGQDKPALVAEFLAMIFL